MCLILLGLHSSLLKCSCGLSLTASCPPQTLFVKHNVCHRIQVNVFQQQTTHISVCDVVTDMQKFGQWTFLCKKGHILYTEETKMSFSAHFNARFQFIFRLVHENDVKCAITFAHTIFHQFSK